MKDFESRLNGAGDQFHLSMQLTPLPLLNDEPAGADANVGAVFNHRLYAELLRDVLLGNRAGLAVGFFARWGQGKSTVVNLLRHDLTGQARVLVFNAYHARGDSVRRQMLLAVLREIAPEKAREFERFSHTVSPLELATVAEQEQHDGLNLLKLLMLEKRFDPVLVGAAVVAVVCTGVLEVQGAQIIFGSATVDSSSGILGWLWGSLFGAIALVARKQTERKDRILAYTQPVSDSQRLKYPEQFAKVFEAAVGDYCRRSGRLILVVDDLDRCEPGTVVEALASVRQFCHGRSTALDCQFLIPCDEAQMISALEADGYALTANQTRYHNYSESEMLRKFFDVVVRMDDIVPESLADFAADQAKKIGVSEALARDVVDACQLSANRARYRLHPRRSSSAGSGWPAVWSSRSGLSSVKPSP